MSGPFGSSQWMYSSGAAVEGQSLRFNDGDSAYLSWTPSTAGTLTKCTFSAWVKRGNLSSSISDIKAIVGTNNGGSSFRDVLRFTDDNGTDVLSFQHRALSSYTLYTPAVFRDPSAWYHIVLAIDTTQATEADRVNIYVNGEAQTLSGTYPPQNNNTQFGRDCAQYIGARSIDGSTIVDFFDGYMAEVNFIDGTQLDPTSFGETDANGQWVPITAPSVTYGTNGFYLTFDGFNGTTATDESSNSNDWTANNLAATDLMLDNPTNNFATVNALSDVSDIVLSEGNLKLTSAVDSWPTLRGTIGASSGKWYYEVVTTDQTRWGAGWGATEFINGNTYSTSGADSLLAYSTDPLDVLDFGTTRSINGSPAFTTSDILQVAIDIDAGKFWLGINNTWVNDSGGTAGDPANGSNELETFTAGAAMYPSFINNRGDLTVNFGQDSSFAGNKTAQGNTDENGFGDFYYAPPTGYLALCSQNLPEPAIADGSEHFNTVLYTGDGTSSRSITGVGFQPDFVWLKTRSAADNHILQDAVRGNDRQLFSNTTEAELNNSTTQLLSFDSDGFTIGSDSGVNGSGRTFASWNWKANGSGSSNTDGTITSTVSANQTAGFSIVSYTGDTTQPKTVGHGLSATPEVVIIKNRNTTDNWSVYHSSVMTAGDGKFMRLNTTDAVLTDGADNVFDTGFSSTTFGVGRSSASGDANDFIAYCFHSVEGYSKFGSYTGNGSTDGPFVYTGFRPAFVMVKATGTASSWFMWDVQRNTYNVATTPLFANASFAEEATLYPIDFLSNGFKLRSSSGLGTNESAAYIYMAFAESPFKYSSAR